jgi:periplasmic divalent cation tolerance protein
MIIVYITCGSRAEASKIGKAMVRKRLAVCANYFPIDSVYEWEGKIAEGKEFVLLMKTAENNFESIKKEAKRMHSYDVPCILKIKASANKEYDDWVRKSVK